MPQSMEILTMLNKEIERKFLVAMPPDLTNEVNKKLVQTYAFGLRFRTTTNADETVSHIAYKGSPSESGMTRVEIERRVPNWICRLVHKFGSRQVSKIRYYMPIYTRYHGFPKLRTIEVDVYSGNNEGLITAEIELESELEILTTPEWIVSELTNTRKYDNYQLAINPYKNWN